MIDNGTTETEEEISRRSDGAARTHLTDCKCEDCTVTESSQSDEADTIETADSETQEVLRSVLFSCPFCGQTQCGEVTLPIVSRPRHSCSDCGTKYPIARSQIQSYHVPHTASKVKSEVSEYMENLQNIREFGRRDDRQWPLFMRYGAIAHMYTVPLYFVLSVFGIGAFGFLPAVAGFSLLALLITSKSLSKKLEHESQEDISFRVTDTVQWKTYLKGRQEGHGVPEFISNNIPSTEPARTRSQSGTAIQSADPDRVEFSDN